MSHDITGEQRAGVAVQDVADYPGQWRSLVPSGDISGAGPRAEGLWGYPVLEPALSLGALCLHTELFCFLSNISAQNPALHESPRRP